MPREIISCPGCNGTGRHQTFGHEIDCPGCNGRGRTQEVGENATGYWYPQCGQCDGKGKIWETYDEPDDHGSCSTCGGSGEGPFGEMRPDDD